MDRTLLVGVAGASLVAMVLVLLYGPLFAAFMAAGTSFLLMLGVMVARGVSLFEHWWHSRSWLPHRTRTH
jgi:hypothetical protein